MTGTKIRPALVLLATAALVAAALPASGSAGADAKRVVRTPASAAGMTASLELRAELRLVSRLGGACPPGASSTTECPSRSGEGPAPGLGNASVAYSYLADLGHPTRSGGSVKILGYPVRFAVSGKGELQVAVAERTDCVSQEAGRSIGQSFTITGGTGMRPGRAPSPFRASSST